jgi:hypothetical protein
MGKSFLTDTPSFRGVMHTKHMPACTYCNSSINLYIIIIKMSSMMLNSFDLGDQELSRISKS